MTNKTFCILLKAIAAFAITAAFGSASFAGDITVHQGKRYRATLALNSVERLAATRSQANFAHWAFVACVFQGQERCVASRCLAPQGCQRDPASSDRCGC